jgi:ABC-2 type transport system permease protein
MKRTTLWTVWYAARSGVTDYTVIFTLRTWLFGWYLRILSQVLFFASIGWLISDSDTRYLLVGNAVSLMSAHALFTTASTTWERRLGTLPLIVASPTSPMVVLAGRSLFWLAEGFVCAVGSLLTVGWLIGVHFPVTRVVLTIPVLLVVGLSTYAMGLLLGTLVLNQTDLRNVVSNIAMTAMMALCGVNVPAQAFGELPGAVAQVLPLTHGLVAIRTVLDAGSVSAILAQTLLECAVGSGWLAAAVGVLHWMQLRARRDGSIVFAE